MHATGLFLMHVYFIRFRALIVWDSWCIKLLSPVKPVEVKATFKRVVFAAKITPRDFRELGRSCLTLHTDARERL